MERFLATVLLAGFALTAGAAAGAQQEQAAPSATPSAANATANVTGNAADTGPSTGPETRPDAGPADQPAVAPAGLDAIPAAPKGTSTIFGGEIKNIDPVRDELTLQVYGEKPMKILFDERTQVFLDGKKVPLHELSREDHASVETTLDGTRIFAVSIHELSHAPEGEYSGKVVSYDSGSGELTLASNGSREPLKVHVAREAAFVREGQPEFTAIRSGPRDLRSGSLIGIEFGSDNEGRAVTDKITVYAVPGAAFAFSGSIASLNVGLGRMVVVDPRDQKSYEISFDSVRNPAARDLRLGEHVSIRAEYDGSHYMASAITPD
jgi:hypothetical protein